MNLRLRENPWRFMLGANAVIFIGSFLHKITLERRKPAREIQTSSVFLKD